MIEGFIIGFVVSSVIDILLVYVLYKVHTLHSGRKEDETR